MTGDRSPPLDALAEALRVYAAASTYGYNSSAAYEAALAALGGLDDEQLRPVAAALAVQAVAFAQLETLAWRYRTKVDLDTWLYYIRSRVAVEERP
jgi:hypothetical protein